MFKKLMILTLSIVFPLFLLVPVTFAKTVKVKLVSSFPIKLPVGGPAWTYFLDAVKVSSDNDIRIKWYDPGKLVPATAVLDTVSKGLAQMGITTPEYSAGKIPAVPIFKNIPFGPDVPERMAWLLRGNGLKLWQELYDKAGYNVKVFPIMQVPAEAVGWFAKPLPEDGDLKGLKMRAGGMAAKVFEKMGASVSFMPMGDIFTALERGALDAVELSFPSLDAVFGYHKIVKYNYFPGFHTPTGSVELLINKDVWENQFSARQRMIIETVSLATVLRSMAIGEAEQADAINKNVTERGVKNMMISPALMMKFREAWAEVVKEESAKDPMFKKIWDDLSAFRANYKRWGDIRHVD